MTTQYTPILKLALPVTGELSGSWGNVVNDNITSMVEQAIAGLATINTWTANAHTLSTADGVTSESRCAMLVAENGAGLAAAGEIICPASSKLYVLKNDTSYAITLKTSAGSGVAVASGETAFLFCDGTNVNACVTTIIDGHITGNLTVDGNATINGNTTLGNATSDTITATARFASGLTPSADNTYDLGSSANSWKDLYIDGTATIATLNVTTIDTTNLEVTNIKAKDGTAAMSIADSTGVVSITANPVLSGGTANGVPYLNGSKVLTTGSALTFDGSVFSVNPGGIPIRMQDIAAAPSSQTAVYVGPSTSALTGTNGDLVLIPRTSTTASIRFYTGSGTATQKYVIQDDGVSIWSPGDSEQMRLTTTGLGIGTSSPAYKLDVSISSGPYSARFNNTSTSTSEYNVVAFGQGASGSAVGYFGTGGSAVGNAAFANSFVVGTQTSNPLVFNTVDTERMRIDSSGNVGIGTSSPAAKLHVSGVSAKLYIDLGGNNYYQATEQIWQNYGGGSEYMRLTSTGLGIGTSSPVGKLVVAVASSSPTAVGIGARVYETTGNYGLNIGATGTYGWIQGLRGETSTLGYNDLVLQLNGGSVGIGTTTHYDGSTKLTVAGRINTSNGTAIGSMNYGGGSVINIGSLSNHPLQLTTNNTTRLVIDTSGNVGIGTSSPSEKLDVSGVIRVSGSPTAPSDDRAAFFNGSGVGPTINGYRFVVKTGNGTTSERLRIDENGNVGIGTSSPVAKVQIGSAGSTGASAATNQLFGDYSTAAQLRLMFNNTGNYIGLGTDGSSNLIFGTSGANAGTSPTALATLTSSGNFGLGVTPSAWSGLKAFEIAGVGSSIASASNNNLFISANAWYNGTNWRYGISAEATQYQSFAGAHRWYTAPSGTAGDAITFTQAMTLDTDGRLGIGTSSPNEKLEVYGASAGVLRLSTAAKAFNIYTNNSDGTLYFRDVVASANRMALDSSGNLGLGVTPSVWGSGYTGLDIKYLGISNTGAGTVDCSFTQNGYYNGTNWIAKYTSPSKRFSISDNGFAFFNGASTTAGSAITFTQAMTLDASGNLLVGTTSSGAPSSSALVLGGNGIIRQGIDSPLTTFTYFYYAGTQVGSITTNGATTAYNTSSDYRLKNTIAPMTGALAKVALLKPCTYKWNADGSDGEGFIAHELAEVCPHAVTGEKDAVDAEGKPVYQGIDTSFLVATLTAALQEQQAIIESLKARLDAANI